QRRITDGVIDAAVASTPPEHRELRGAELARRLRARRDALPGRARRFYAQLADQAELRATDQPERAEVDRAPDGTVEVRLFAGREPGGGEPYFQRRFLPADTREIRVYLRGGEDLAVVRGEAERSILVRVVGGGGDDALVDSSRVAGGA